MELKYDGKSFLGVIKFFDAVTGFGFIASNCCGMPDQSEYDQDFYVDTSSFSDGKHVRDGGIVVFQIEQQSSNRVKAVNVRLITKSDEDKELVLKYYDDYEIIELKEGSVNVFRHLKNHYSNEQLLEIAKQRIEIEEQRNAERTTKLFSSLIGHFYTKKINGATQYVFDYETDNRKQWEKFFKELTSEELIAIIKEYPTAVSFTKDQSIITDWIANYKDKELDMPTLMMLKSTMEHLPKRRGTTIQIIINKNVDRLVQELIDKYKDRVSFYEYEVTDTTNQFQILTGEDYDFVLKRCQDAQRINELRTSLVGLKSSKYCNQDAYKAAECYRNLSDEGKQIITEEIKNAIYEKISFLGESGYVFEIFKLLGVFSFLGDQFIKPFYETYQKKADEALLKTIEGDRVNDAKQLESFIDLYRDYYEGNCPDELIATAKQQLLSATSLQALNMMYYKYSSSWSTETNISFLTREEIFERVKEVISNWSYQELNDFINSKRDVFEKEDLDQIVINRAFDLIGEIPLSKPFDGDAPKKQSFFEALSGETTPDRSKVIEENCSFLKALGHLTKDYQTKERWHNYIQSCNYQEKLALPLVTGGIR